MDIDEIAQGILGIIAAFIVLGVVGLALIYAIPYLVVLFVVGLALFAVLAGAYAVAFVIYFFVYGVLTLIEFIESLL